MGVVESAERTQRRRSEIDVKGDVLTISLVGREKPKKQADVSLSSHTESSIRTILTNLYRIGIDRLIIHVPDKEAIRIIEETVKSNLIDFLFWFS